MKVIECNNLTKCFRTKNALDKLSFSLEENKIVGLIGRNGAGKTTFLKTCAGYIRPTSGELKLWGEQPFDNMNLLSDLIFIDEEIQYNTVLKLKEILKLGAIYYKNWDAAFADKLLRYFGLNENKKYKSLSRGMKTQFNIIMGLASRSTLTLLDEPTLGLDAAVRKEFYNILLRDFSEHPRTIVISSHLLSELENLLEEIVLIREGTLVLHKPIEEFQNYAVYLNGKRDTVLSYIENREVLNVESFGNSVIAAIKNNLSEDDHSYLTANNVDISKVSVEDVCIYLTKKVEGGEFDDFE